LHGSLLTFRIIASVKLMTEVSAIALNSDRQQHQEAGQQSQYLTNFCDKDISHN
jgi:hypothetical protein